MPKVPPKNPYHTTSRNPIDGSHTTNPTVTPVSDNQLVSPGTSQESIQEVVSDLLQGLGVSLQQSGKLMRLLSLPQNNRQAPPKINLSGQPKKIASPLSGTPLSKPKGIVATGVRITAPAGLTIKRSTLAVFRNLPDNHTPSAFKATVSWGDGSSVDEANITTFGRLFKVTGSHTYPTPGRFTITVSVRTVYSSAPYATKITTEGIIGSFKDRYVLDAYQNVLGRYPTSPEVRRAIKSLKDDPTGLHLKRILTSSGDYFKNRGKGTTAGFLTALYQDVLGRPVTYDESVNGARSAGTARGRALLTDKILRSDEAKKTFPLNEQISRFPNILTNENEPLLDRMLALYGLDRTVAFPILWTEYENQYRYDDITDDITKVEDKDPTELTHNPFWPSNKAGGSIFLVKGEPKWEWVPVLHPEYPLWEWYSGGTDPSGKPLRNWLVGVSGWAGGIKLTTPDEEDIAEFAKRRPDLAPNSPVDPMEVLHLHDVPFSHPFGRDFSFGLAPDFRYWPLMSPTDLDLSPTAPWFELEPDGARALAEVREKVFNNQDTPWSVPGTLHVEIDEGLIPQDYWPSTTQSALPDRVALFGRWIVDAGHDNFGSEMHPPLLVVKASKQDEDTTYSKIICRPYLASTIFSWGETNTVYTDESHLSPDGVKQNYGDVNGLRQHIENTLKGVGKQLVGAAAELAESILLPFLVPLGVEAFESPDRNTMRVDPIILPGLAAENCHNVSYYLRSPSPR